MGGSNNQLLLEPGFIYELSANVELFGELTRNKWTMIELMTGFGHKVVDTKVSKTKLDYFSRNKAIVQFSLQFDPVVLNTIIVPNYEISELFSDICAISILFTWAVALTTFWHKLIGQTTIYTWDLEQPMEKQKESKDVAILYA